ncbi:MAG: zinc ribbon domain-containing protein [Firmicutes bacterium]|nr:zinc ribbon domain-containing protein [Bacillota bacterium]
MKCKKCGNELPENCSFCPNCGEKVESQSHVKTIQLKCSVCGGMMEVDANKEKITCPFCGTEEIIVDSDAVAVEKIKRDVEYAKMDNDNQKRIEQEKKEAQEAYKKGKINKITIGLTILCLIFVFTSFKSGHYLAGIIALMQAGLFGTSWLMGMQIIVEIKKNLHLALFALALILMVPFFKANSTKVYEKIDWPKEGIVQEIPKPKSKYGEVIFYDNDSFNATLNKISETDYRDYVEQCKKMGFTVDMEYDTDDFKAYDEEGYLLEIDYYSSLEEMRVQLEAPETLGNLVWPTSELAKRLPKPSSSEGKVNSETSDYLNVTVGKTSQAEYDKYVEKVSNAGFNVDYSKQEKSYHAEDKEGYYVSLKYVGNNTMSIRLEAPEKEEVEVKASEPVKEEKKEPEKKEEPKNDASLREFLDDYEEFMDQYIAFMQKYEKSDNVASMLIDYGKMMSKYAEMTEKLENFDTDSMTSEDYAYYMEVMTRVNNKLYSALGE